MSNLFVLASTLVFLLLTNTVSAQAVSSYNNAKDEFLKEKVFYTQNKQYYLDAKQKYAKAKNSQNQADLEVKAKDYLGSSVDVMIAQAEVIKAFAQTVKGVQEEDRSVWIRELDQSIAWLQDRKPKIESASGNEIKEEATVVRHYYDEYKADLKRITGSILSARADYALKQAQDFASKVNDKITQLKANNKDTTNLETWYSEYTKNVDLADQKYAAAKQKFSSISSGANADSLFKEGNQFLKDGNKYLKDAHAGLVEITKQLKNSEATSSGTTP